MHAVGVMPELFGVSMPLGVECNGTKIRDTERQ